MNKAVAIEIRRYIGGNLNEDGIPKFLKRYMKTQSLQNWIGKRMKIYTTTNNERRIVSLSLRDTGKSPRSIQDEMAQRNVKLSPRTVQHRLQEFGIHREFNGKTNCLRHNDIPLIE